MSVVWHLSLPLMNSFNKTATAIFPCGLCFPRAAPFIGLMQDAITVSFDQNFTDAVNPASVNMRNCQI